MNWYVFIDNEKYGPYSFEQLTTYIQEGRIYSRQLVWRIGFPEWVPAGEVKELAGYFRQEEGYKSAPPTNKPDVFRIFLILCCLIAIGFFAFRAYSFFQEKYRLIHDPIKTSITSEGENITETVKIGKTEIPFNMVFGDDTSGDGYTDRRSFYQDDLLVLAAWDTDADGIFDIWFRFANGEYVDLEAYDLTGDGKIDKLVSMDENEQIISVESYKKELDILAAGSTLGLSALPLIFILILLVVNNMRLRS